MLQKMHTRRLLSSSFLGLPYRILNINHKKDLLRTLGFGGLGLQSCGVRGFRTEGLVG